MSNHVRTAIKQRDVNSLLNCSTLPTSVHTEPNGPFRSRPEVLPYVFGPD